MQPLADIIEEPYCFPTTHSSGSPTVSRLIMSVVYAKIASFVSVYHLIIISSLLKGLKIRLRSPFSMSAFLSSFPLLLTFLITICQLKVHLNLKKFQKQPRLFNARDWAKKTSDKGDHFEHAQMFNKYLLMPSKPPTVILRPRSTLIVSLRHERYVAWKSNRETSLVKQITEIIPFFLERSLKSIVNLFSTLIHNMFSFW